MASDNATLSSGTIDRDAALAPRAAVVTSVDEQAFRAASPEASVLLICSKPHIDEADATRAAGFMSGGLNWQCLLDQADRHCVLGLLYLNLRQHDLLRRVPQESRQALDLAAQRDSVRNMRMFGELLRVLRLFAAERITVLPFKGPILSKAAYGDFLLRSCCDLDILIDLEDMHRAQSALEKSGYRPSFNLSRKDERAYLRSECAFQMRDDVRGFVIELHWRLTEQNTSVALPITDFWQHSVPMTIGGSQVPTFCPEDLCLYLCIHGAKHHWERLEWIACLAQIIVNNNHSIDWAAIVNRAEQYRVARLLHLGLWLVHTLFSVPLPECVVDAMLSDRMAQSLAEQVSGNLFCEAPPQSHYQQRAQTYLFMLRTRENWVDRFCILFFAAVRAPHPGADEWRLELPPRLAFLQRIIRPVRLLSEYGAVAWHWYFTRHDFKKKV